MSMFNEIYVATIMSIPILHMENEDTQVWNWNKEGIYTI